MDDRFDPRQLALAQAKLPEDKLAHSLRVGRMAARQGPAYATVGLLHDMLENSNVTRDDLRAVGASESELAAIELLTRETEAYEAYVTEIEQSGDRLALSVKICDLLDHLDPADNAGLTDQKVEKYLWALPVIIAALRAVNAADSPAD